ncbi:MAG: hypothetical protein IKV77_01065 [Alistipes sp.]|nr:hypothetical protein [Alistipes sp.]
METTKKNIESANTVNNATAEAMLTAVTGKEVAPSGTPPTPKSEKKGKEAKPKSEAQRKAEELQREMERKQAELAECLKVLEAKKELSAKRSTFIDTLDKINTAEEVLNEDDTFEVTNYRLIFANSGAPSYREESIFKISNRELLLHFVDFIRDKINKKIAEIEAELVK